MSKTEAVTIWRKCACGVEMTPGNEGCKWTHLESTGGKYVKRIPHDGDGSCHDCNTAPGQVHHDNCDTERCPFCGGQALGCECWKAYGEVA